MLCPMLFVSSVLRALFYLIDRLAWNREAPEVRAKSAVTREISIEGLHNVLYLFAVALTVLASGIWKGNAAVPIGLGIELPASGLLRDATLILIRLLSWRTTKSSTERPVNAAYFWLTGVLSSFLDNAPTYLAFFNLAGGD